jgi:hypothetical protein
MCGCEEMLRLPIVRVMLAGVAAVTVTVTPPPPAAEPVTEPPEPTDAG